jgi:hypothetical protein
LKQLQLIQILHINAESAATPRVVAANVPAINRAVAVEWLKGGSGKRGRSLTRPKIGGRGGAAIYGAVTLSSFMRIRAVNGALGKAETPCMHAGKTGRSS